jgi:hypothetical protein
MKRCNLHIMPLNGQRDFSFGWNQPVIEKAYKKVNGA